MSVTPAFGPLQGQHSVEEACVATVEKWMVTYIREVERQNGVKAGVIEPPATIYGAVDVSEWDDQHMPCAIVAVDPPEGPPVKTASEGYTVGYRVTFAVVSQSSGRSEDAVDTARHLASLYAIALMGAVSQQLADDHPGLVDDVRMVAAPYPMLQDPDERLIYTGQVSFDVFVSPLVKDTIGPNDPIPDGHTPIPDFQVTSTDLTVAAPPSTLTTTVKNP